MLGISVLEHALRAKHLLVALAEKLYLFVLMCVTVLDPAILGGTGSTGASARVHLRNRQGRKYGIVDWEVVSTGVVRYLVKRTLDDGMLVDLAETFEAECVSAWKGERLFL